MLLILKMYFSWHYWFPSDLYVGSILVCDLGYRVGIDIPKVEVRFQNLEIEGDAFVGTRALPTLWNSTLNALEV